MHKNVEALLGRLATDPALRKRFARDAHALLRELAELGFELTRVEIDALATTDLHALTAFAASLDGRLQRAAIHDLHTSEDT